MAEETIGGRPVTITKDGDKVKIVFHPAAKNAKHPKAALFTITLSNADLTPFITIFCILKPFYQE